MGRGSVIVRSPFQEMIRNIKRGRIWASVLEINNNYLGTTEGLAQYGRGHEFILPDGDPWGSRDEGSSATGSRTACHYVPALAYWHPPWLQRAKYSAYIPPIG